VTKKIVAVATTLAFGTALSFAVAIPRAHAAGKVDCDKVMEELNSGKKTKEVASDLSISAASVRRCKRKHAKMMASPAAMASPEAPAAPAPAPAPAGH